ncbi:MAG TPA: ABC transporter permease [Bryobacteraceae bacterium]|nr:ABC transporter permease [Bryobacteraceae bacterium]
MNKFAKRLRALWHRRQLDRDLADEMAFHLEMNRRHGAAARFGNVTAFQETCRDLWAFTALEAWWQDVRFALRTLRGSPLVTSTAIVALALGIGANTTVFTIVGSALRFDMAVDHIDRIVAIHPGAGLANTAPDAPAPIDFLNLRSQVRTVENLAAYRFSFVNVSDRHALPERCWRVQMTASGWAMVRPKPQLGREFGPEDERSNATPAVILSHRLWERRYGDDPAIVGKYIRIDDVDHMVVGVMPAGEQFPEDTDLWTPVTLNDLGRPDFLRSLLIFGRLANGTTLSAAQSEIDGVARRAIAQKVDGPVVNVRPFLEMIGIYDARAMLYAMLFAVAFVLLIVCADVANLMLGRAAARVREISIRIAIGAGRARIVRQLLVESVLLSAAGGIAGWLVALAGLHWFDNLSAQGRRPSWIHFAMDARGFLYLAGISVAAGILFGLAPALQLAKVDVNGAIKDGGRGAEGPRGRKLAGLLVGFQMALCVILLAASGLMIHSTVKLYNAPLSFEPANVLTMRVDLPETKYSDRDSVRRFYDRLKSDLAHLPGVSSVSLASHLPMAGWREFRGEVEGTPGKPPVMGELDGLTVDAAYFPALDVRLRQGRVFDENGQSQVVVNERFAAMFWGGGNPVGKRLRIAGRDGPQPWLTVIGVAADIQQDRVRPLGNAPLIYLPYNQDPQASVYVIARTAIPPAHLVESFRRTVQSLDENLPAQDVLPLADHIAQQRLNVTSFGKLFSIFAAIALVLAWVGLYAVVAHAVSRRTQEIGIRMAVGGTRKDIFGLVVKQGMRQVLGGFAAGLPVAMLVTRGLSHGLVGVSPSDPATYAGVATVLGIAGLLGCAIPARRAIHVDPLAALRHE